MKTAKKIEGRICPVCGSIENQILYGKSGSGVVRHKCKNCGKVYSMENKGNGYSEEVRQQAIKAFYSGISGRQVGKLFHMSKANVYNWIKKNRDSVDKFQDGK